MSSLPSRTYHYPVIFCSLELLLSSDGLFYFKRNHGPMLGLFIVLDNEKQFFVVRTIGAFEYGEIDNLL